jgi:Fic family protein
MEVFKLKAPDVSDKIDPILRRISAIENIHEYTVSTIYPKYLHWDKIKHKPMPEGLTPKEFWAVVKLLRRHAIGRAKTVVRDESGKHFTWQPLPKLDYFLHKVDLELGGNLRSTSADDTRDREWYMARGVIEEAISSSQLEGAVTTRRVAKRMLQEKRKPVSVDERMILNNYIAMQAVEKSLRKEKLTRQKILDLHRTITEGTKKDSKQVGRFRTDADEIVVVDPKTGDILHIPPSEKFMKAEMKRFLDYANEEPSPGSFVHPVIKAIILHFWIGYLHPFTDGNGRFARLMFYWYLQKKKYWGISYLPISRVIKSAPSQYRMAYVYSEQDDNDLTYFIDYNIRKLAQAKDEFDEYVKRKAAERRTLWDLVSSRYRLNERQIRLLRFFHKNPTETTSIETHSNVYGVSRPTAKKDLVKLEELGFLRSEKVGRERLFTATKKVAKLSHR